MPFFLLKSRKKRGGEESSDETYSCCSKNSSMFTVICAQSIDSRIESICLGFLVALNIQRKIWKIRTHLKKLCSKSKECFAEHAEGKTIDVWFQDEARFSQQNTISCV